MLRLITLCTTLLLTCPVIDAAPLEDTSEPESVQEWEFRVTLDGKNIGKQSVSLTRINTQQIVFVKAYFDIKVLFFNAFRYRHENTEVWENGCLKKLDASTDNNGTMQAVRGFRMNKVLQVESNESVQILSGCIATFAYWNLEVLKNSNLLNSQTGEYQAVALKRDGSANLNIEGNAVAAVRYQLTTKNENITLYYSAKDQTWLGLEAPVRGGRVLRYSLIQLTGPKHY